ncbi:4829_t:CDS:2 [Paraglomus brasilianum]|uniref:4829_t:CDS:1 n=1 Tax=Paraglomus brasilianum TaxID=144538 RepID=A0A9N9F2X5_9GLOM|nr:4829_t:CDS:2 [Paraglomus brasilianum]
MKLRKQQQLAELKPSRIIAIRAMLDIDLAYPNYFAQLSHSTGRMSRPGKPAALEFVRLEKDKKELVLKFRAPQDSGLAWLTIPSLTNVWRRSAKKTTRKIKAAQQRIVYTTVHLRPPQSFHLSFMLTIGKCLKIYYTLIL